MKTLLELMYEADAVQIDDLFIRYFYVESEEIEDDEDDTYEQEEKEVEERYKDTP